MSEKERQELERLEVVGACGGPLALVGDEPQAFLGGIVLETLEGDGGTGGVACELQHAEGVVGFEADTLVDVEARMFPGEHGLGSTRRSSGPVVGRFVQMRIVAFILEAPVIARILQHLRRRGRDPQAMHDELQMAGGRAPP